MSDLQAKYQKLAAEYSKVRAQIPILKKAVLDEQAAGEELKETLKNRDQSIRKFEQEADSLTFRNQQLESRVAILQNELDQALQNHGKKQKNKSSITSNLMPSIDVIDEELKLKIEENAKLHRQVLELDQEHQREVLQLERRLKELQAESSRCQLSLEDYRSSHQEQFVKLTEEKKTLGENLKLQELEAANLLQKVKEIKDELTSTKEHLTRKLESKERLIRQKLSFNDAADETLNSLNVGFSNVQNQVQSCDLMSQANQISEHLMTSFENLFDHLKVKTNMSLNSDLVGADDDLKQFLQRLNESDSYLCPMRASLEQANSSLDSHSNIPLVSPEHLLSLSNMVGSFIIYIKQIISCQLQCLEIESSQSSCTSMLSAKISDLQRSFVSFASTLTEVQDILSTILTDNYNKETVGKHKPLMQLSQLVMTLMESCRELLASYKSKSSLEHQLPTCGINIKVADEKITSSLSDLTISLSKLSSFLSSNIQSTAGLLDCAFSSDHPCVPLLRLKAVQYREFVSRSAPESVPLSVAIHNRKLVECFAENKNDLSQQVLQLQERLNKAEQEREQWSLEAQLMTTKYRKEIEKFNVLARNNKLSPVEFLERQVNDLHSGMTLVSELGKLVVAEELGEADNHDWVMTRETIVSGHYDRRINELLSNLQLADSKAVYFHSECRALHKQLFSCLKERDRLQAEVHSTNQDLAKLRDELQTTSRSYEGQLSLMSEHLASMNEKLATQKDEIDALKHQLLQCLPHQQANQGTKALLKRNKF